ncbi:MAG: hypothetical protein DSY55_02085, partial [Clostridia bacterium]
MAVQARRWEALIVFIVISLMAVMMLPLHVTAKSPLAGAADSRLQQGGPTQFSFAVSADERGFAGAGYDSSDYYRGVLEAIDARGKGAFMVSPGDIDAPVDSRWTIDHVLGADYMWYPVVGNHEEETSSDIEYLRNYDYDANGAGVEPDIFNYGPSGCPETTYSFDYGNAHFVVLNEYCDRFGDNVLDGDIRDHVYNWLQADLQATTKEHIFVFGHEPAYPQPDADTGSSRHVGDSLDKYPTRRNRFWNLLKNEGVVAYVVGHTHRYSAVKIDGVWQVDAGHARGKGDTSAPSTFLIFHVNNGEVTMDVYRDVHDGVYDYDDITYHETLKYDVPTATPTPTLPAPATGTLDIRVGNGADDVEELLADGSIKTTSSDLEFGQGDGWPGGGDQTQKIGIRFQGVQIPQGATITSAYIEFETDETSTEATSVTFYGEASDDAVAFSATAYDVSNRTRTSASVAWNSIPAWDMVNEKHQSPDLSAVVQEIVNRPGWGQGHSMAFIIEGAGKRVAESYNGEAAAAPLLHVVYDSNASTATPTPVPTATTIPTEVPTLTPTSIPTATPTAPPTATPEPTATPTATATATPDPTATPTATATATP